MISQARLKFLRSLKRKKNRLKEGLLLVEGIHVVQEAVACRKTRELFITDAFANTERGNALLDTGLPTHRLEQRDVKDLTETETPAGIFALAETPVQPLDPQALRRLRKDALVLLAAGVADPGNLGTLIRTAAALGAQAVVTAPNTVEATNPKVVRASAGVVFRIPMLHGDPAILKEAGYEIVVADAHGTPLNEWKNRPKRLALAVGNEPRGVDEALADLADRTVSIPIAEGVESLNVAIAAGILLHAFRTLPIQPQTPRSR